MRIGDAAAAAGTTPRALRFYEANGLLPPPRRSVTGQRVYGTRDVARVRVIRRLLSLGLTVADLRDCAGPLDLLEDEDLPAYGAPGACSNPSGVAARRIATLNAEIDRLTGLRDRLAAHLEAGRPSLPADGSSSPAVGRW
ncbi:MerR family transcriptional regulator [Actinoplanes lobatus]|uniref:DNA-binding transcriptional MerR regulator n=1 Tax=Actinoplanes lobatus TaxID=113568 RepID=A0A7W7MI55_9ACTN|nr:MerR family transcriptional regulator [Actinoplanes lobatus]MBB4751144.1 DNA-binding transcriptional MerR regulator [Actinoplanes lobatus]GGN94568.1 MerR family transcriptional regulator [Actinoplanes lobatus]GIE44640.1 MerR family transcriptional regulator [Actinoplanes lobatus]